MWRDYTFGKERKIIDDTAVRRFSFLLIVLLFLAPSPIEGREVFPLDQVEKGLLGVGKTVFSGQEVEAFDVEILGLIKNNPPVDHLILIKLLDDDIERGGGIASGMSGSPIYVEDKLLGAIGYGWTLTDHRLGLVTPIEDMLLLWEEETDLLLFEEYLDLEEQEIDLQSWALDSTDVVRVKTPLQVSGVGERALTLLKEELSDYQVYPVYGGGIREEELDHDLVPGSAMAVQLMRGDVNVSAIGTVTHREGNRILGFGHPFLFRGGSGYLISGAYIHQVIQSQQMPFKLGSPTQLQGTLLVDRMAGIAGELYRYPSVVPLRISVLDKDRDQTTRTNVQMVRDEEFLLSLSMMSALEAIDRAIDRIGKGTAEVTMELTAHALPDKVLIRENIYNSQIDIASVSIMELGQILNLLTFNPFQDVEFIDMRLDIEVTSQISMATIKEILVSNEEVYPGDLLEVEVILQPYREEEEKLFFWVDLPEDVNTGTATLSVMSGFEARYEQGYYEEEYEDISGHAITSDFTSLEEMLQAFQDQPKNNQIYLEIWPQYRGGMMEEGASSDGELEVNDRMKESQTTSYFLTGALSTTFEILPHPLEEEDEEEDAEDEEEEEKEEADTRREDKEDS